MANTASTWQCVVVTGSTWRLLPRKISPIYCRVSYVAVTRIPSLVLRNTWPDVIINTLQLRRTSYICCSYEAALRIGVTTALAHFWKKVHGRGRGDVGVASHEHRISLGVTPLSHPQRLASRFALLRNVHWASKETYHFFRATLTKNHCIKINHIYTQIGYSSPYEAHLKNKTVAFAKKEKNAMKSQKVTFQKSQKLLAENLHERTPIQNIQ